MRRELPADIEVAEAFFRAEAALNVPRGGEVCSMKHGGEVEKITSLKQLQEAIALTGLFLYNFNDISDFFIVTVLSLLMISWALFGIAVF